MMKTKNVKWQQMTVSATAEYCKTNASCGLTRKEARSRFRSMGANTLFDKPKRLDRQLLAFLTDPACLMAVFVMLLLICFGEPFEGVSMLPVLLCVALMICRVLLWRKQLSAEADRIRMPSVHVIRNGHEHLTVAHNLVCGDLIILRCGDIVPADCRLVRSKELRVMMPMTDEKGRQRLQESARSAEVIYPPAATAHPLLYENMLYGGSEVSAGAALAIVVATGEDCLLAGSFCSAQQDEQDETVCGVRPYAKLFSSALFALMIPLVIVAMLYADGDVSFLTRFASYAAWVACGAQAVLLFEFCIPSVFHRIQYLSETNSQKKVLYSSVRSERRLAMLSDLVVLGRCGCSDGTLHLHRCAVGNRELEIGQASDAVGAQSLCEALLLHQIAMRAEREVLDDDFDCLQTVRRELLAFSNFDADALATRLTDCRVYARDSEECLLDVRLKSGEFRLLLTKDRSRIDRCTFYEQEHRTAVFANADRERLHRFCREKYSKGAEMLCIVKQVGTQMIFLGALALRERLLNSTREFFGEIDKLGVRTTLCLREHPDAALRYTKAVGLPDPVSASGCDSDQLLALAKHHRVLCALTPEQTTTLVKQLRAEHKRVGVLGNDYVDVRTMRAATLSVAVIADRSEDAALSDEHHTVAIRQADITVFRNKTQPGGLASVAEEIRACRAVLHREEQILRLLILTQLSTLTFAVFATLFGIGVIGSAPMLYLGLLCPMLSSFWLSILPVAKKGGASMRILDVKQVQTMLADVRFWIPAVMTALVAVLGAFVLKVLAVIDGAASLSFLFGTMLMCELCSLFRVSFSFAPKFTKKRFWLPFLVLTVPAASALLLGTLFPCMGIPLGTAGFGWQSLLFLLLVPVLYWLFCRLISSFFNRTAK